MYIYLFIIYLSQRCIYIYIYIYMVITVFYMIIAFNKDCFLKKLTNIYNGSTLLSL